LLLCFPAKGDAVSLSQGHNLLDAPKPEERKKEKKRGEIEAKEKVDTAPYMEKGA